jgi:hypothetical protein
MDAFWIMDHLDTRPQPPLNALDEVPALLFTYVFKSILGIEGWDETGYAADGRGILVRDAQWSTDFFWTADIKIVFFRILNLIKWGPDPWALEKPGLFIRLEIRPFTVAHTVVHAHKGIKQKQKIAFKGPVLLDHDASFLEVHPTHVWFLRPDQQ